MYINRASRFATILLLTVSSLINAQFQKGSWLVEGSIGNVEFFRDSRTTRSAYNGAIRASRGYALTLYPRSGYFVSSRFVLGAALNFSCKRHAYSAYTNTETISEQSELKENLVGLSPFMRCYFGKPSKNRFYAELAIGASMPLMSKQESTLYSYYNYYSNRSNVVTISSENSGYAIAGDALIGFNHFFSDNLAFNTSIGYHYGERTVNYDYTTTGNISMLNVADSDYLEVNRLAWNFGFTMIIGAKKDPK